MLFLISLKCNLLGASQVKSTTTLGLGDIKSRILSAFPHDRNEEKLFTKHRYHKSSLLVKLFALALSVPVALAMFKCPPVCFLFS